MDETGPSEGVQSNADSDATAVPLTAIPKVGTLAWSFIGVVIATIIVVTALSAVSEIILPLLFAAVLAVIFKPVAGMLQRHRFKPSLAAAVLVLGLLVLMTVVMVGTVRGVLDQTDEIGASVNAAIDKASGDLGVDPDSLNDAKAATQEAAPMIREGVATALVSGVNSVLGLVSGLILGALIMYYLLKDGAALRRKVVSEIDDPSFRDDVDDFIGDACGILRDYGRGRTVMSAVVAVVVALASLLLGLPLVFTIFVVNFIGGYIPYIGAFLGGGLAVIIAWGDGGLGVAAIMLVIVLASNLLLENFVEPKVMGRTLDIHPLVVLIVTALGGFLAGIVGLILAVPFTVIAGNAIGRLRSRGFFGVVADRAKPTVKSMLD
jgi:predicted PurR-regulated permease PerM